MTHLHVLGLVLLGSLALTACAKGNGNGLGGSGGSSDPSAGSGGSSSSSSGVGVPDCDSFCDKWDAASCPNQEACPDLCDGPMVFPQCTSAYQAFFVCATVKGTYGCGADGKVEGPLECIPELNVLTECVTGRPLGGGECYEAQGACNPLVPTSCAPGDQCDITSTDGFVCFPPPNDSLLGEFCDNANGPFCEMGLLCDQGQSNTCLEYCCDDADCSSGTCVPLGQVGDTVIQGCL